MSNPIKHNEIVESGNPFEEAINGAKELMAVMNKLKAEAVALTKSMVASQRTTPSNTKAGQGGISNGAEDIVKMQATINKLNAEIAELTRKYNSLTQASKNYNTAVQKLTEEEKTLIKLEQLKAKELSALNGSYAKLSASMARMKYEQKNFHEVGTAGYKKLDAQINQVDKSLKKLDAAHGVFGRNVGNYVSAVRNAWMGITTAMAGTFYAVKRWVMMNAELSDSMAAVRRTTGMTQVEVNNLNERLRTLNTRTAQNSLLDLAHVAGKLGIAKDEIFGFVKAADMIGVALGKDLGNNEEAINQLGRIVQIFKVSEGGVGMEKALLKVGSALKDLGNASVAEETNIIDFTKRMGGLASVTGVSIDKIMGLGATMDILGQTMEVSSTAVNQIWIGMAQKTEKFAKIAGMSVLDFKKLMTRDFNEAFIAVAEGLQKSKGGVFELAEYFNGLGLDGRRLIGVMSVLAGNIGQFRTQMDIAKKSLDAGTTAGQQFAIQNETLAASIDKATKAFNNFVANSGILTLMQQAAQKMAASFDQMSISASIVKMALSGGLVGAFKLNVPSTEEELQGKKSEASKTKNETLRRGLMMEISLGEKVLEIEKLRRKNQEAISKLKQDELQRMLAQGLLNPDGSKKTKAEINADKLASREAAKALKEQQKLEEEYYQFLLSINKVTTQEIIDHERKKLIEQGVWKKATVEEQAQWEYQIKKKYAEKDFSDTMVRVSNLMGILRSVNGSKDFKGGKYNIPSGPNGENPGLMQGGLPTPEGLRPMDDRSGDLAKGLKALYDYNAGGPLDVETWQDKFKKIVAVVQEFSQQVSNLLGSISANYQVNMENDLAASEAKYTKEYEMLDQAVAGKTMSERNAANQKLALEKKQKAEQLRIEKEHKKKQQDLAYIQAIINIAQGVTMSIAQMGMPLGLIGAAMAIAAGAIELDTISSQKFAKGGSGEVLKGARHSQGGIKIPGVGEAEGGEYFAIINREATQRYSNELPVLFDSINNQRYDQLFSKKGMPTVNVNVNDRYGEKMLAEMKKTKAETRVYNEGNFTVHETGNYRFKTSRQ